MRLQCPPLPESLGERLRVDAPEGAHLLNGPKCSSFVVVDILPGAIGENFFDRVAVALAVFVSPRQAVPEAKHLGDALELVPRMICDEISHK